MTRTRMVVLGILLLGGCVSAWKLVSGASLALVPRQEFVIHEWGTFSTVSGSDGVARKFYPTDEDLPRFVHGQPDVQNAKGRAPVLVSMETPVLYFYSDRERTASVQVDFPEGRITEWYPQASQLPNRRLTWNNVKVFPKDAPLALKQEQAGNRYFAARATDASPVQVQAAAGGTENEKFLFYRGVGDFKMPISVRALGGGRFKVRNEGKEAIPALVLVRAQGGKVHFKTLLRLSEGAEETIAESTLATTTDKLGDEVARLLAAQGLYEKEARAMVKTWQSDWFSEEGTRVLYVVPRPVTERILPIRLDPRPDSLVRVLVGRHDVLTPEREREIAALVQQADAPSDVIAQPARQKLQSMGRFRWEIERVWAATRADAERLKQKQLAGEQRN